MSDSPSLFQRPSVRAGIVATIIVLIAYGAKMYKDHAPTPLDQTQKQVTGLLQDAVKALEKAASDTKDFEAYKKTLPRQTTWYPQHACGGLEQSFGEVPASWKTLPVSWAKGKSSYSFRFHQTSTHLVYIARRDLDCDGVFEVHQLKVKSSWTGGMNKTQAEVHNPSE